MNPGGLTTYHRRTHQKQQPWKRARYCEDELDNSNAEQQEEEVEDTPQRPVVFPEAGTPLPGPPAAHPCNSPGWDPLFPFESKLQWDFCRTHVEENTGKSSLDRMIRRGLFKDGSNVRSADHLRELIHAMDDGLDCEWEENTIDIEGVDTEYWFRDPMTILRYLFSHLPFKTHLAYAPIKDYGSDGKRLYCEMWTGNWWWQQQVNAPTA